MSAAKYGVMAAMCLALAGLAQAATAQTLQDAAPSLAPGSSTSVPGSASSSAPSFASPSASPSASSSTSSSAPPSTPPSASSSTPFTSPSAPSPTPSSTPSLASSSTPPLPPLSPADQQRADKLAHGLRCLVCQNQTLADSNAPLAHDMRNLIHAQLADGRSDAQIMRFFEHRYGDFVRYDPPFKPVTWVLWLGPFALLALGFWVLLRTLKRRASARTPLTEDERARATRFLESGS